MLAAVVITLAGIGTAMCDDQREFNISPGKLVIVNSPTPRDSYAASVVHCSIICTDDTDCTAAMFDHESKACSIWSSAVGQTVSLTDDPKYTAILTIRNVRLNYGSYGTVEILHDGQWGTVCDDAFENVDATVVCQSLGYGSGTMVSGATYGQGSGPIWLDDVGCNGGELGIDFCTHPGWGVNNCGHGEDVGVVCS